MPPNLSANDTSLPPGLRLVFEKLPTVATLKAVWSAIDLFASGALIVGGVLLLMKSRRGISAFVGAAVASILLDVLGRLAQLTRYRSLLRSEVWENLRACSLAVFGWGVFYVRHPETRRYLDLKASAARRKKRS